MVVEVTCTDGGVRPVGHSQCVGVQFVSHFSVLGTAVSRTEGRSFKNVLSAE